MTLDHTHHSWTAQRRRSLQPQQTTSTCIFQAFSQLSQTLLLEPGKLSNRRLICDHSILVLEFQTEIATAFSVRHTAHSAPSQLLGNVYLDCNLRCGRPQQLMEEQILDLSLLNMVVQLSEAHNFKFVFFEQTWSFLAVCRVV